jgi:hypothetical protein
MASSVVVSSSSRSRSALESFFTPASVVVISATEREGSVGRTIFENLVHSSYRGQVFAVNPKRSELLGTKCYSSVAALPEPVDLAVIVTCPYRKCHPARMPSKSATISSIRANPATKCNKVTCPAADQITIRQGTGQNFRNR